MTLGYVYFSGKEINLTQCLAFTCWILKSVVAHDQSQSSL